MSMETSRGVYKPIRVLFDTPIYETAVKACWNLQGYKIQIAMMLQFLRLQQKNQTPFYITAEDMSDLLVKESKKTAREQLWKYKLDGLEETEAKPLLKLVWAVNVINKMRDVEFQARMLLKFPEATPPTFQTPKLLKLARKYIEVLKERQQESQTSRLLTVEEVVIEVIPRVVQDFWQLPSQPLLNMASQSLSILSTSLTKATLDKVSKTVTTMESQAIFSRSIRGDVVQTILTEIREQFHLDTLLNSISNFAPVLLKTIAVVAKKHICKLFEETTFQSWPMSEVQVSEETPAEPPSLPEVQASEERPAEPPSLPGVQASEECPAEPPSLAEVQASEESPAEPPSLAEVQVSEETSAQPPSLAEVQVSEETSAQPPSLAEAQVSEETSAEPPSLAEAQVSEETSVEPPSLAEVQVSEETSTQPPSLAEAQVSEETSVEPPSLAEVQVNEESPAEPPSLAEVQVREETSAEPPSFAEVQVNEESPAEPPSLAEVQANEESPAEPPSLAEVQAGEETPAEPPSLAEVQAGEETPAEPPSNKKKNKKRFLQKFLRTVCCCCIRPTATE